MRDLVHKITTDFQFLYACIAYEESCLENELVIITETKLSKVYPIIKKVNGMESVGEDYWGRYSFKDENEQYYCELDGELYFKGNSMEGEPHYPVKKAIHYDVPDIDSGLIEFKEFLDKAKKYIQDSDLSIELVEAEPSLKLNSSNILESKIICKYTIKKK